MSGSSTFDFSVNGDDYVVVAGGSESGDEPSEGVLEDSVGINLGGEDVVFFVEGSSRPGDVDVGVAHFSGLVEDTTEVKLDVGSLGSWVWVSEGLVQFDVEDCLVGTVA